MYQQKSARPPSHDCLPQANPLYTKEPILEPSRIPLKMLAPQPPPLPTTTIPTIPRVRVRIKREQTVEQEQNEKQQSNKQESQLGKYYAKYRLVYQKYDNTAVNCYQEREYYAGTFTSVELLANVKSTACVVAPGQPDDLHFDSNFESGNLFAAYKVSDYEYDLIMENDCNSIGNNQWFYFSLANVMPNIEYLLNVVNFGKSDSLFNYGMRPMVKSAVGGQWARIGTHVHYNKGQIRKQGRKGYYYRMSFHLKWHIAEKIYIAQGLPYTYSELCHNIAELCLAYPEAITRVEIGKTLGNRGIVGLVVGGSWKKQKKDQRKAVVVLARQHPGEVQGSYVCEGMLKRLLVRGCREMEVLRKNYLFYMVPMVNPDGVASGHYRTNLAGKDLNRKWDGSESSEEVPEVTAIKKFIAEISKQRDIRFILDLHGHSKKLGSFFYGNPCPDTPELVRLYPYICSRLEPAVCFQECTFAIEEYKKKAARVQLSNAHKQLHSYTYEVSFYGYDHGGRVVEFDAHKLQGLGENLANSLFFFLEPETNTGARKSTGYEKFMTQLREQRGLIQVGEQNQSGSDSKPEEGEIAMAIPEDTKKITQNSSISYRKNPKKPTRQFRFVNKPQRNMRYLQLGTVDSVVPNKYQLSLKPSHRKSSTLAHHLQPPTPIIKINALCQTEPTQTVPACHFYIDRNCSLSRSIPVQLKMPKTYRRRSSSIVNAAGNSNKMVLKIDFSQGRNSISWLDPSKIVCHAYSQTVVSAYAHQQNARGKPGNVLPPVETLQSSRSAKRTQKYETVRTSIKEEAESYLNGVVKKMLKDREIKEQGPIMDRPMLRVRRKELFFK